MLVNLKEVFKYAEENKCAIGAFNTPTLENLRAVLENAEELNVPVIIMHAEMHENITPIKIIGPVMIELAKRAKVPVCVHVDHGEHVDYLKKAIDLGFTSVMYDGSLLPYEINVNNTKEIVKYAHEHNATVEAEIGALAAREGGEKINGGAVYTEPNEAKMFVDDTGIDALACSFGTAHGVYKVKPKLDFERIKIIRKLINIPLVMHGGSGLPEEDYVHAIKCGVEKINYCTYMMKAGYEALKADVESNNYSVFHRVINNAYLAMKADSLKAMRVFYNK